MSAAARDAGAAPEDAPGRAGCQAGDDARPHRGHDPTTRLHRVGTRATLNVTSRLQGWEDATFWASQVERPGRGRADGRRWARWGGLREETSGSAEAAADAAEAPMALGGVRRAPRGAPARVVVQLRTRGRGAAAVRPPAPRPRGPGDPAHRRIRRTERSSSRLALYN